MNSYPEITFAYRLLIDQTSQTVWEKHIFEETYHEFLIQSNVFQPQNDKTDLFRDLLKKVPASQQLHYLLGMRILPNIGLLKGNLYPVTDVLEKNYLKFIHYELDLVQSSCTDSTQHQIGITFYSIPYLLIDKIHGLYLVSEEMEPTDGIYKTQMFPHQKHFSIHTYQP